jgi:hypothetical protein
LTTDNHFLAADYLYFQHIVFSWLMNIYSWLLFWLSLLERWLSLFDS